MTVIYNWELSPDVAVPLSLIIETFCPFFVTSLSHVYDKWRLVRDLNQQESYP